MIHEIFPVGPLQCNCSIIGDEVTHEAMVIDPGDDIEDVLALLRKHNLQVKQIVITHAHIDHVGGAMKLRAATGAPILLNQNDYALLKMLDVQAAWIGMAAPGEVEIDQSLSAGDTVKAGAHAASILHTPGHTEGSICLYFASEKMLICGGHVVRRIHRPYRLARRIDAEDHAVAAWHRARLARPNGGCSRPRSADHHRRGTGKQSVAEGIENYSALKNSVISREFQSTGPINLRRTIPVRSMT